MTPAVGGADVVRGGCDRERGLLGHNREQDHEHAMLDGGR